MSNELEPAGLSVLATAINAEHRACETALRTGLAHAIKAGELLIEARALCPYGTWLPWLRENFEGSERLARNYIQVARELPKLQAENGNGVADLSFREALAALAAPSPRHPDDGAPTGTYADAVHRAAGLVETIVGSWWTVAETLYELTTGEDPAQLADVCAAMSRAADGPMTVEEGAVRRATWIAYGAIPVEDRPWPEEAALSMRRLGVTI